MMPTLCILSGHTTLEKYTVDMPLLNVLSWHPMKLCKQSLMQRSFFEQFAGNYFLAEQGKSYTAWTERQCVECGNTMIVRASQIISGRQPWKYCSWKCARKYNKFGANNPKWRGGIITRSDGRRLIYVADHPYAIKGRRGGSYVLEYRLIVEKHIGRYLKPGEIVHHKDGNARNNRISNLEVTSLSEHMREHCKEWRDSKTGRFVKK